MRATAMERDPDELMEELEAALFQLTQDVVAVEGADVEVTTKLNMIAEMLEDAESAFRKDRTPPYRREGHLIGNLLQVLEQQDEFYPTLESKLSELTDNRVKAAACRVLLATVPVNSRFIVRLLYDEEMLEHMCEYAGDAEPPLRCYATGLLAVGLRDRSVADIVVNKDTPVKLLQRVRLYASKLERERHHATKYIQENLRNANSGRARRVGGSSGLNQGSKASTTNPTRSGPTLKRKFSESGMRGAGEIGAASDGDVVASQVSMVDDSDSIDSTLETSSFHTQQGTDEEQLATAASAGLLAFQPDPQQHEEDLKKIVMLELLYTLDCIGLMGEYLELFAPALKEDIIGTIVTFLYSKNPTVLSHILKLTSHFLAHKKFCFSLVDAGGVDLIFATAKRYQSTGQPGLLDRSLSMCLHGLASSSAVIEKILLTSPEPLLSTSFGLLSSPNDRARQNAVVFYGLTLPFKQVDFESDSIVQEWTCHAPSSAIVDLETNESTRMQSANRLILTGSAALTPFGVSEVALWDVKSMETARWRFSGGLLPRFNNFGDRIVALDARAAEDDQDMDEEADVTGAVMVDIATGNVLCELKDTMHSNDYKRATNCCFSTDDSTILTGGILWDARIPTRALYKFDKLSNVGYGCFHPNGNEIIINSAVWDLRTFQLLRMVPALDKCNVRFNSVGSVMFSYNPHQLTEDIERRRGRAKTWFRVLDARDYREISTIELERPIYDLSIDQKSSLLSVVEGRYLDAESYVDDDPVCRLYEVGRKRPSEDDSDVEDAHDQDSDAMDEDEFDESESATDEEEDEEEEEDDDDGEEDDDDEEEEGEGDDGYAQYYYDDEGAGDDDGDGLRYVEVDDQDGSEDDEEYEDEDGDVEEDSEQRSPRHHRRRSRTSRRTPMLSARDIHFLLEIPDTEYYDVHDEYSSEEDDEDNDEEEE
ncbi:hypothetical protein Poli38472_011013 [Pythium oligandrum]|uniref:LisH domain-containing protein n=1 Tax=Pythium oligandrum TaxID=41045 RepID=A0A8K1FRA3_PYTOL|nr:hypothetical protein Poli38472_011013 [Pythium oligandrum]|eukprot:TMW67393.1 hypothetical protein Poli38472_011013 [Pythium oligandrum]